ncbi:MAG: GntR family transcriptional regulator [Oscillospiraceae bacterium]|jgi:DNA-binding transcriptional regulator YhcF (GntR family)
MIPLTSRQAGPVWDQVAGGLERLVRAGAFLPGEMLPSPKELAWQMVLNPNAVRSAYERLVAQGVLEQDEHAAYRVAERSEET